MIKKNILLLLLPLILYGIHFLIDLSLFEEKSLMAADLFINYFLLFLLNGIVVFLIVINKRLKMMNFAGVFIIFTTIQMLACMSYALFVVQTKSEPKIILIHFLIAFFINLILQSLILNKVQKKYS